MSIIAMIKDINDTELIDWVTKVSNEFYELIYNDPWFKKIFRNIGQEIITLQQIDFMVQSLGGPQKYCGRSPKDAHPHIWVDQNIWDYRENLLIQALNKVNPPGEIKEKWLKIDRAFKNSIINQGGKEECQGRYKTEEIIYEPMPEYLKTKIKKAA